MSHVAKRRRRQSLTRNKISPVGIVVFILLLLVLAGAVYTAVGYRGKIRELEAANQVLVDEARERLDAARAAYDAIDPSTMEGSQRQLETENELIEAGRQRTEELESEIRELETDIDLAEQRKTELEADEETEYYLTVYESYRQGMEKVEERIEGN